VTERREDWVQALAGSLRGPRRRRERLVAELEQHLDEATAEELAAGAEPAEAEAAALRRVGTAGAVAAEWNADAAARRSAARLRVATLTVVVAAFAAPVAIAQASGTSQSRPHKPQTQTQVRRERAGAPGRAS
jgi:hypothetical protein